MSAAPLPAAALREAALDAGFHLCGLARPEPIPAEVLGDWLAAGMHADMDWMSARVADRLDVTRLLPSAGAVMALACSYPQGVEGSPIARYAQGRDYHATLRDRIRGLRRRLRERYPELETYGSVDSGPLMEKVWAVRGGLGYVGRNGCLITERYGSWVVLAVMVLGREVDAYAPGPAADRCGDCTLCITSCPTEALVGEGRVDARRCISYQTIENEGAVPSPLRPGFRDVAFGCDVCQEVCPLNRQALAPEDLRFGPRAVASLGVRELAALTAEAYERLIPGTALARARYDGLRRNAVYALGAARDAGARELLERLSTDASELVRSAAQWALAQLPP